MTKFFKSSTKKQTLKATPDGSIETPSGSALKRNFKQQRKQLKKKEKELKQKTDIIVRT